MKNQPFFSIVIPTKNRPNYLKESILSVLMQKFQDYELIVSDNFNDKKTKDVIDKFTSNSRLKYYRTTSELNMIDHWEFATTKASGKYVLLLSDRKLLFNGALVKLYKEINRFPDINIFSFQVQMFNENKGYFIDRNTPSKTKVIPIEILIDNFLTCNIFSKNSLDRCFPKTQNGIYKNSFALQIRKKYGNYFNVHGVTTPDFSSFFINCALNKKIVFIGKNIVLAQGESLSNGRAFGNGKYKEYFNSLSLQHPFNELKIKAPFIYCLLMIDFQAIKNKFKGNLLSFTINEENYFRTTRFELLFKKNNQIDYDDYIFFENSWNEGIKEAKLEHLKDKIIRSVEKEYYVIEEIDFLNKIIWFRSHFKDFLRIRLSKQHFLNKFIKYYYTSAIEAAGYYYKKK